MPTGIKSAARTRNQARPGNVRALPREYVRLKQTQTPGTNDFVISVSVPQNAALSGLSASRHIAPNKFSSAKVNMPTEKHQLATERSFRHAAAAARAKPKTLAAKAKIVLRPTIAPGWHDGSRCRPSDGARLQPIWKSKSHSFSKKDALQV